MNRIQYGNPGGEPVTQDSLNFLQNAWQEIFNSVFSMFAGLPQVIISGCQLSLNGATNTYWCSSGYIYIAAFGEIFYVPATDTTLADIDGVQFYWQVNDTSIVPDPSIFANLVPRNIHRQRRAVLTTNGTAYIYIPQINFTNLIYNTCVGPRLAFPGWTNIGADGAPVYNTGYGGNLRYSKDVTGRVWLEGNFTTDDTTGQTIFTLPAGYRIDRDQGFVIGQVGSVQTTRLIVNADGTVNDTSYGGGSDNNSAYYISISFIATQ